MRNIEVNISKELGETTYTTTLEDGLTVYICKKEGFEKKIGLFGTKYGSLTNDFIDIITGKRIKVPDGIAHFLEHKLFEKEGANALDLFSKMGVSSNAYTSFDQTVFFFETIDKFKESIEMLVKLIKEPYFTDENVDKEQGIIGQEISMYDDDPSFTVYFNALRAMYKNHPIKIDIAGTIESISHITKYLLYTCYNTFYSPQNMFFVVIGDVGVEETINLIDINIKKYEKNNVNKEKITKFIVEEPEEINKKEIIKEMDIYMPLLCVGYKLNVVNEYENLKRQIICEIISDLYFSKISDFYEQEYNKGLLADEMSFDYEGTDSFSHVIISASSTKIDILKNDILKYLKEIKNKDIDKNDFELIKRKKIGYNEFSADNLNSSYRRIIEHSLYGEELYSDIKILNEITIEDIKEFLNILSQDKQVISIVKGK